ncbi:efflux transporter outer membrane subunit [Humidesulfovibrio sp.]
MRRVSCTFLAFGLACVMLLGGCNLAPKYQRPSPALPPDWTVGVPSTAQSGAKPQDWRQVVTDEPLKRLIELALANNRDLRVSALKIEKAMAQHEIRRADLLPKLDATAGADMQRTPAKLSPTGLATTTRTYSVGLGVSSFELDFFGRVRNLKEQALEEYLATEAAHKSFELSMVAEVGAAYLGLAADREHLALAREILATEQSSYGIIRDRIELGVANELDLARAQTTVDMARNAVAQYTVQVTEDENLLQQLVGMPLAPDMLPAQTLAQVAPMEHVPAGLPSEVLARRPDIAAAEHRLKGANANIGAARAMHFPVISLTGSYGTASNAVNGLFKPGAWAWTFLPQISLPIFHGGAISAGVKVAEAERDILVAQYEKSVQTAFREVSNTLAQGDALTEQVAAQTSLTTATGKSFELATLRYDAGVDSFLSKLDAQRSDASARQNLISARLGRQVNYLTLYKVLGGGWEEQEATSRIAEPGAK